MFLHAFGFRVKSILETFIKMANRCIAFFFLQNSNYRQFFIVISTVILCISLNGRPKEYKKYLLTIKV